MTLDNFAFFPEKVHQPETAEPTKVSLNDRQQCVILGLKVVVWLSVYSF